MNLVLARVDERLLHGQVSAGWVPVLGAQRILVADDALAADAWERDLVASAAPPGVEVEILPLDRTTPRLQEAGEERTLLLVRNPRGMLALVRSGAPITAVNLGGLHYHEGARRFLDYVFLTPEDIEALSGIVQLHVHVKAQDLPGHPGIEIDRLLVDGLLAFDRLPAR